MLRNYEPIITWKKILSWKTVLGFVVVIGGFYLGYYTQTYFHARGQGADTVVTASGQPPSDLSEDPYIIDFSHQGLLEFPNFLLERPSITDLILANNSIPSLPEDISRVEKLRVLDMRYNDLSGPLTNAVASLGLIDLNLSNNQLTSIPQEIGQITTLRYFDISQNQITEVPATIVELQDLKWLNLAGNDIAPAEIDELKQQMPSTIINF